METYCEDDSVVTEHIKAKKWTVSMINNMV